MVALIGEVASSVIGFLPSCLVGSTEVDFKGKRWCLVMISETVNSTILVVVAIDSAMGLLLLQMVSQETLWK
jgi:hypothetical protein